jgi:toxin-antitoxin system PIN domain toxin
MTLLLDVNVLIALMDPAHPDHNAADTWFAALQNPSWATCPITENAVLRILGTPSYRNSPGPPAVVAGLLNKACHLPGHVFWDDSISLLDDARVHTVQLQTPGQITDLYLLALARSYGGQLATFDRRIRPEAVEGGREALLFIPT